VHAVISIRIGLMQILAFALTAIGLFAADATGKWTRTLTVTRDGQERERPAQLVLKQDGDKLTGTAGPDASEQHAIPYGPDIRTTVSVAVADSAPLLPTAFHYPYA
jgi:hypothetical protein